MPNFDRTGPLGQGPLTGKRSGLGRSGVLGRAKLPKGRGLGGSKECTCPKCGHIEPHIRRVPCSEKKCPKCGAQMKGVFCL